MSATSHSSKAMVDDDKTNNKVVLTPLAASATHHSESDIVMVADDEKKLENHASGDEITESNSKTKDGTSQPSSRNRSTDFASIFMKPFRKAYPTTTSESVPLPDEKVGGTEKNTGSATDPSVEEFRSFLQENTQVEAKVEADSDKDASQGSLVVDAGVEEDSPVIGVKDDNKASRLQYPHNAVGMMTMDTTPGFPVSTGPPSPVNLDRDGDVATVASQTMEIPSSDGDLSGSVLSFKIDDAMSTMSDELLQTMEEEVLQDVDTRPADRDHVHLDASPPSHGFSARLGMEENEPDVTPEGVKAMAGELGLNSFMMVGEHLMRRSQATEVLVEDTRTDDGDLNIRRRRMAGMVALPLLTLLFMMLWGTWQVAPETSFIAVISNAATGTLAISRTLRTKLFGGEVVGIEEQEISVVEKNSTNYLTEILFGQDTTDLPGETDHNEEEHRFISSLLNTSHWVDADPPSLLEWPQDLAFGAAMRSVVDMEYSGQCVSGFWKVVDLASSLSTFCQALFGWAILSLFLGVAACVALLTNWRKNIDGDISVSKDAKIPKQENTTKSPKVEKYEIHEQGDDELRVAVDLSKYKLLRKDALKSILKDRNCRIGGLKSELIHRLVEDYHSELDSLAYRALQRRLKKQGLVAVGKRGDLIIRLLEVGLE